MKTSCLTVCVLFLASCCSSQSVGKSNRTLPTTEEIELAVTQAERAFNQYRRSVDIEAELPTAEKENSALENDRKIIELSGELIEGLKKRPESFNGLGGLLLLTTLDDASRNAALCSSTSMSDIGNELLSRPDINAANRMLSIAQQCTDVSLSLYTVSESVNALLVRTMEAQEDLNGQVMATLDRCTSAMKSAMKQK